MSKVFIVDVAKCSGCYNCQLVCKDEHCGNDWSPYAAAQPDTGQFWMKVEEHARGTIPKVKVHYLPKLCNHCAKPACAGACEKNAIEQRNDGLNYIDPDKCDGCGACAEACPYGVIYMNENKGIAQKCTGCAHLLDGGYKLPRCAEACPTDALRFGDEEEFAEELRGAQGLLPELGQEPRVRYVNMPGCFIAGTVFDPKEREVIIGARVVAVSGGKVLDTTSDEYGDFWFKDLPAAKYDLTILAEGYEPKNFYGIDAADCPNVGDIPLETAGGL